MKIYIVLIITSFMILQLTAENSVLLKINSNQFEMGSNLSSESEPVHLVEIDGFYVSKDLVTKAEYESIFGAPFLGDATDQKKHNLTPELSVKPITDISWIKAIEFCNRVSKKEGLNNYYNIPENSWDPKDITINKKSNGYRLLTEAEWEYIARNIEFR